MVFGGGILQSSILKLAKHLGFSTLMIDPDPQAYSRDICDHFRIVRGDDFTTTLELAKEFNVQGLITAGTDKPLFMMARVAAELELPFPGYSAVEKTTRKDIFKRVLMDNGIPCAKGFSIDSLEGIEKTIETLGMQDPFILKPVDNSGSRGVVSAKTIHEIKEYFNYSMSFSGQKKVIIEEYITGPEFSVESLTYHGETKIIQVTEKVTTSAPYNVELGHIQPVRLTRPAQARIGEEVKRMIHCLQLDHCACHTELKYYNDKIIIIENGARLGGDFITSMLVPASTGISMEKAVIDMACGIKPDLGESLDHGSCIRYLELPCGTVDHIGPLENISKNPEILELSFTKKVGDTIPSITNSLDRYGYLIAKGKTRSLAIENADSGVKAMKEMIVIR